MLIAGPATSIATFSGLRGRFAVGDNPDGGAAPPGVMSNATDIPVGPAAPGVAAPVIDAAPCIAIAYRSSVANEQSSRRESRGKLSSQTGRARHVKFGYWIERLGQSLRYHAQMVYRVCECFGLF